MAAVEAEVASGMDWATSTAEIDRKKERDGAKFDGHRAGS